MKRAGPEPRHFTSEQDRARAGSQQLHAPGFDDAAHPAPAIIAQLINPSDRRCSKHHHFVRPRPQVPLRHPTRLSSNYLMPKPAEPLRPGGNGGVTAL